MSSPGQTLLFRLARAVVTLWLVVTVVFMILRLSGDPAALLLPEDATPEQIESLRRHLGLDQPISVQYGKYWLNLAQGDLGDSLRFNQPATGLVIERLPATAWLALAAFLLSTVSGLSVGIVTALLRGSFWDRAVMALMSVLQSSPSFFLGIILILVFTVKLGWLPSSGTGSARHLILPAVTLSALSLASLARLTRSTLLDVLRADYIRTARAKGMTERVVALRHALRNASLPVVTVLGLELAGLLTGTVIVEIVFAWPGVGRLAVQSVSFRDYPVVQATVLLITAIFVLVNLLVDLSYFFLDPRVRHD